MPRSFDMAIEYEGTPVQVHNAFCDKDYWLARLAASGADDATLDAVRVGHDWSTPVVWSIAQHHPDRCLGVAGVCIPYLPAGFVFDELVRLVDRTTYPEEDYPVGQWDYWLYYAESLDEAAAATGENPYRTVKLTFRAGDPAARGAVAPSARMRATLAS